MNILKNKVIINTISLIIVFLIATIFIFIYILHIDNESNKCVSNGGKTIYNQFGLYEKCVKGE